ncbi:hypothetical protein [Acidovorax sp. Root217]|uniref:hypothetical protein n=1 Tax=Acidovorax sp. Root217 TaxID=1736492 RepID=UPI000A7750C8|nr:hypothetical protein [Acidovorax sp. Root217]
MTCPTDIASPVREFLALSSAQQPCAVPRRALLASAGVLLAAAAWSPAALAAADPWSRSGASVDAQRLVRWVAASANHQGMAFAVIDKPAATIHVFGPAGGYAGSAPVLLGSALGDRSAPGIGQKPLSQIRSHERTTPAGRFVSEPGSNLQGHDIVWIDYDAAVSLHRVRGAPAERRVQRLASPVLAERRISNGCVNSPAEFYNRCVAPWFGREAGVVYVLPDSEPFATFFPAADAAYPLANLPS